MRRSGYLAIFAGAVIVAFSALIGFPLVFFGDGPPAGQEFVLTVAAVLIATGIGLQLASTVAGSFDDGTGDHDGDAEHDVTSGGTRHDDSRREFTDSAENPATALGRIANIIVYAGAGTFLIGCVADLFAPRDGGANIGSGVIMLAAGVILIAGVALTLIAASRRRTERRRGIA
ncbi:hypothetical protein [Brevibacterium luteolum]|uniref:Uncharacterized protein n=1 Tax=Brevibacterium luteolum TaxID=199591 RepID=A0A6G8KZR1_9MICO|nr:hypothetical protein [Brevibacterium luteolum]MCT1655881.1 hypothetical protein [Brevibacterium luteolum]QIN30269.1 hypothetical protein EW640_14115 [Brevibacterium luteolum]